MARCQFGAKEVEFLGRTISPAGMAPQSHKIEKYLQILSSHEQNRAPKLHRVVN